MLYKFQKCNENSFNSVKYSNLFLAKPSSFSDLFDSSLPIDYGGSVLDEKITKAIFDSISKTGIIGNHRIDGFKILCVSKKWDVPKMWEDYAKNEGFCIGFEFIDTDDLWIEDVVYTNNRPGLELNITGIYKKKSDIPIYKNEDKLLDEYTSNHIIDFLFHKNLDYQFENEKRVIIPKSLLSKCEDVICVGDKHYLSVNIKEIILGPEFDVNSDFGKRLLTLTKKIGLPVYQTYLSTNSYSIIKKQFKEEKS